MVRGCLSHAEARGSSFCVSTADGVLEGLHQLCVLCQGPWAQHGALRCYVRGGAPLGSGSSDSHRPLHHLEVPAAKGHPSPPFLRPEPLPGQPNGTQPPQGHGVP